MKPLPSFLSRTLYLFAYASFLFTPDFAGAANPRVIATTTFIADMARNIAGNHAEVISLMPVGGDPHTYDPVPGDAKKIAEADLILKNGLTLEGWLNEMIDNSGTHAYVVTITEGVTAIQSADHENAYDPHAWMDLQNALIYIANIRDALIRIDPPHASDYQKNYDDYRKELQLLDDYVEAQILRIPPEHRILATSHDAFRYYGNRYGLQVVSILGTSTDAEARIEDYNYLASLIRKYKVPAIFIESTINPKLLIQLAQDLGIRIGGKLFADSLGDEKSGADTYLKMIRQNTDLIVAGLMISSAIKEDEQSLSFLLVIFALFILSFSVVVFRLKNPSKTGLSWENYKIEIKSLSVSYDRKTALANVFIEIEPGYVYGLLGGNGSGKSTLFKSILGLVEADAGSIRINGEPVDSVRKYISYIPQKEEIDWTFPATVFDVVLLGRYPHRGVFERLQEEDRRKAAEAMQLLGIYDLKDKQIGELSGGQQQRVFIARALCQEAELYLFDEPFVGVDVTTENKIIEIVKSLAAQGKLVVIIHHDLAKVREYFDRLIMVNQRIIAIGDTEEVFTDENIKKTYGGRLTILQKTETIR
ncbi:MAG: zinc ABC transporter substrate-binding protein [Bacteroidia bacterium]|nr:zinc ABC transporter substrate-binding protein [Bacteroidia bacterium]